MPASFLYQILPRYLPRLVSGVAMLVCLFAGLPLSAQPTDSIPAASSTKMDEGRKYEESRELSAAADSYRAAVKAGRTCRPCLLALARVQAAMDLYKESAASYMQASTLAPDAPGRSHDEASAAQVLWGGYFDLRDGLGEHAKDPKKAAASLAAASMAVEKAVADAAANEQARMLRGHVLAALRKDEDASREFAACAAIPGTSADECARALRFSRNVAIAREQAAPTFTATTLAGKPVTLASLSGKIVLIDFWATWCKFCERDSDYVQSTLDAFDKDKYVLLEVSVDDDERKWRSYVRSNRLEGVQTRDDTKTVADAFHVTGYPTYIVLDGDGNIRMRAVGAEADMKKEIRLLLAEAQPAASPDTRKPLPKLAAP